MLKYMGYTGYVEFDDEAGLFHGEVTLVRADNAKYEGQFNKGEFEGLGKTVIFISLERSFSVSTTFTSIIVFSDASVLVTSVSTFSIFFSGTTQTFPL